MANTLKFGNGEWYGKEGTILAYNSENNNYKPLPFTFDRASSATRVNKQGLIEVVGADQPRVDYLNDSNGALLLEPSRTNYLLQSNQFDTTWGTSSATVTSGQIGVGGSSNAWLLNSSSEGYLFQYLTNGNTLSIYAKAGSVNNIRLKIFGTSNGEGYFNLSNGTKGASSGLEDSSIESVGNGWYRCNISINFTVSLVRIYPSVNSSSSTGTNGYVYIQNSQLEAGSYATSYIPTQGSAVTRLAESCSQTVPDGVIGQTEGTILVDFNFDGDISGNRSVAVLSSGGSADFVASFIFNNLFYARIRANNGSSFDVTKSNLTSGNHKIAIAYASNDLTFYLDGNIVGQNTSASVSFGSELSTIKIGEGTSGTAELGGLVSKTSLYNTRLSNSELAALTQV